MGLTKKIGNEDNRRQEGCWISNCRSNLHSMPFLRRRVASPDPIGRNRAGTRRWVSQHLPDAVCSGARQMQYLFPAVGRQNEEGMERQDSGASWNGRRHGRPAYAAHCMGPHACATGRQPSPRFSGLAGWGRWEHRQERSKSRSVTSPSILPRLDVGCLSGRSSPHKLNLEHHLGYLKGNMTHKGFDIS